MIYISLGLESLSVTKINKWKGKASRKSMGFKNFSSYLNISKAISSYRTLSIFNKSKVSPFQKDTDLTINYPLPLITKGVTKTGLTKKTWNKSNFKNFHEDMNKRECGSHALLNEQPKWLIKTWKKFIPGIKPWPLRWQDMMLYP